MAGFLKDCQRGFERRIERLVMGVRRFAEVGATAAENSLVSFAERSRSFISASYTSRRFQ